MANYDFTNQWFGGSEIRRYISNFVDPNKKNTILEIGSFEGQSSCYFSDVFLNHPESSLDCVDPFDLNDKTTPLTNDTKERFLKNIRNSANFTKITFYQQYSTDFFKNSKKYNFIYIDGSHELDQIRIDMTECWKLLEEGGIMWMDDYRGADGFSIKMCMDEVLKELSSHTVIHVGYQLAIRKN